MLFRQYEGGSAIKLEKLVSSRLGIVVDIAHTDEDEKGSGERRKGCFSLFSQLARTL